MAKYNKITYTSTGLQEEVDLKPSTRVAISIKASSDAVYTLKGRVSQLAELVEVDTGNYTNISGDLLINVDSYGYLEFFALDISNLGTAGAIIVDYVSL